MGRGAIGAGDGEATPEMWGLRAVPLPPHESRSGGLPLILRGVTVKKTGLGEGTERRRDF